MTDENPKKRNHQVFISYAESDRQVAGEICSALENNGIHCWIAFRDIPPGEDWIKALLKAVAKSKVMVVVFSADAAKSDYVKIEIGVALYKNIKIILSRIEDITPGGVLKEVEARFQWLDAWNKTKQEVPELVVNSVRDCQKKIKKERNIMLTKRILFTVPVIILLIIVLLFFGFGDNGVPELEMVHIPKGDFLRGTSEAEITKLVNDYPNWRREWFKNEIPQGKIFLDSFYITKFEITNKQYKRFLEDNPDYEKPAYWDNDNLNASEQPVVGVSWYDADAFCDWLSKKKKKNYRLPMEAEWEKAARATDGRAFPWGNKEPDIKIVNFSLPYGKPMPVGYYPGGINRDYKTMEMAGNIAEWCKDWYDENYYKNPKDTHNPEGPLSGREKVLRGGSFIDIAFFLRCTARSSYPPDTKKEFLGFRIVRIPDN